MFMVTLLPPHIDENKGLLKDPSLLDFYYKDSDVVSLIVENVFFFLFGLSFLLASFTPPGGVPSVWPWDPDAIEPEVMSASRSARVSAGSQSEDKLVSPFGVSSEREKEDEELEAAGFPIRLLRQRGIERKLDGRTRFCRICGRYKPDRSHHCRMVGTCVLEMDHYCPWIRNCVGFFNKKYFILLLMYGVCSLLTFCICIVPHFVHACGKMSEPSHFFIVFSWMFAALLGVVLVCFFIFHLWLMSRSYTTIEFCEKRNAGHSKRNVKGMKVREIYSKSPYDRGIYNNWKHLLGPNPLLWFFPTRYGMPRSVYAGCVFEVNETHHLAIRRTRSSGGSSTDSSPESDNGKPLVGNNGGSQYI